MGKFDDDLHLVEPSEYVPTTVQALLHHVGASDAPRTEQAAAIRTWLETHQPSQMMEYSIRDSGFGELLGRRAAV